MAAHFQPKHTVSRRRFGMLTLGGTIPVLLPGCRSMAGRDPALATSDFHPVETMAAAQDGLKRVPPEAAGIPSQAILDFLDELAESHLELHSFMLSRGGNVVAEGWWWPYVPNRIHMTHSLTKSVTACAVGIAIGEGRFGLDDKVVSFFPEHVPPGASANLKAMTVRDLLTMRTGHDHETSGSVWRQISTSWVAEFMKIPVPFEPGTKWVYTSAASFMLSAIVTRTTGQTVRDYLQPRMFEPLGIGVLHWDLSPGGINPGGNGLSWTTAASLKLGMLHAQGGLWNGHRILPAAWVEEATRKQVPDGPYGYQWWIGPGNAYYALGLFVQLSIVFPEHDAVLATFAAIKDSSMLLPHVWKRFPAAFGSNLLTESPATAALKRRTNSLRLLPELKAEPSPVPVPSARHFAILDNDQGVKSASLAFLPDRIEYTIVDAAGTHSIVNGTANWLEQRSTMSGARLHHEYDPAEMVVVAGARWRDPSTLELTWQFVETAFRDTVVCRFDGNRITIDRSVNLNSAETSLPTLKGVIA